MKMQWRRSRAMMGALLLSATMLFGGCEKSASEHLAVADSAIKKGEPDRAEESIKQALAKDPDNKEAKLRMVQVHILRKQYEKAEAVLDEMWKAQGGDEEKLSTQQKIIKNRLKKENYPTLYREWADSMDATANPQKYEEIVRKGLVYDEKDNRMNTMLVNFYLKRGEQLIVEGKKEQAAQTFEKIYPLLTTSKTRNESQERASKLRKEVYAEATTQRFEKEQLPKLVAAQRFVEQDKTILFMVEGEYDKKLSDEQAKAIALRDINAQINGFVLQVGALPAQTATGAAYKLEGVQIVEEEYKRGAYTLKVSAPLDSLMAYTMLVKSRADAATAAAEKAKKKAGKEGAAPEEDAKDSPPAPEGEQPEAAPEGAKTQETTPK